MKHRIALIILLAACNAASVFASSLDQVQFLKIAPKDARAVIKGADGKLKVIKVGDVIADGASVKEIAPGRIVLEEKVGEENETVLVTIANDRTKIQRMRKKPDDKPMTVAPAKTDQ